MHMENTLQIRHCNHESIKKEKYEQRVIDVEHSTFNLLVFACTVCAGPTATRALKQIAAKISEKRKERSLTSFPLFKQRLVSFLCEAATSASDGVVRYEKETDQRETCHLPFN